MEKSVKERAGRYGVESLFDIEAFSLLSGIKMDVLNEFQNIRELQSQYKRLELTKLQGQKLEAFFELCKRIGKQTKGVINKITNPKDVYNLVKWEMEDLQKEQFRIILLNVKCKVISINKVSEGSLSACIVHPREVLKEAILQSAYSFIAVHNHPSGDTTPSKEDIAITKRLRDAGETIGIQLLDHVIVGKEEYISLKEEGCL